MARRLAADEKEPRIGEELPHLGKDLVEQEGDAVQVRPPVKTAQEQDGSRLASRLGVRDEVSGIDAVLDQGFDAVITNAAGCGSTLKEYHELLADDEAYREKAQRFSRLMNLNVWMP